MAIRTGKTGLAQSSRNKSLNIKDNPWLSAVIAATKSMEETVPEGWYTIKQLAAMEFKGYSANRVSTFIRRLCKLGRVECKAFRIYTGKVIRLIPHYKLVKEVK